MTTLILASGSPRRRALLMAAGVSFTVEPQDVDETPREGELPIPYVTRLAEEKARALRDPRGAAVLAADTIVALDGRPIGKAKDDGDAKRILATLAGRVHYVHTAVALLVPERPRALSLMVTTAVRFRAFSSTEIDRYVASGESADRAGAYAVQGDGGSLVAEIRGSYSNVVGLPLEETLELLSAGGVLG